MIGFQWPVIQGPSEILPKNWTLPDGVDSRLGNIIALDRTGVTDSEDSTMGNSLQRRIGLQEAAAVLRKTELGQQEWR